MKIHLVQVIATPEVGEGAGIDERIYNAVNDAIIAHECLNLDYRTLICMGDDMCFICNMHKWVKGPGFRYEEVKD